MQPLNFCRQIIKQDKANPMEGLSEIAEVAEKATKFCLPDGGKIIDDTELRGLDGNVELHLPFNLTALEYLVSEEPKEGEIKSSKRVVVAEERENDLACKAAFWADASNKWLALHDFSIPKTDYLFKQDDKIVLRVHTSSPVVSDIQHELESLLDFINALQCSNVSITKEKRRKSNKSSKDALPFDDYHFLTIARAENSAASQATGGSHRSPREHLRRGHIRRLPTGKKVWVSATVVCAGRGGKVSKDYLMALDTAKVQP